MGALRTKMIEEMRLRNFSPRTQQSYLGAVMGLVKHYRQSPDQLDAEQIRSYLLPLQERGLSPSSCNVAISGLKFFYHNGLSWAYVQTHDISKLSQKQQNLLVQGHASILDKLVKVPQIVAGQSPSPLCQEREPLKLFKETIKPFRDSIVHASPFSAPERFGGYEKLSKVYQLTTETVRMAMDVSLEIISTIHRFVGGAEPMPPWVPPRKDDEAFAVE